MQVLIGTTNPAKLKLFKQVLDGWPITFVTLRDLNITAEPEEMGRNPAENAAVKAAFYGQFADYVICNDSGLYFDNLELDDPRQPGLHIRTPQGKRLDDEQMIDYYSQLVHSLGGKVLAYYLDGFAVKTPQGVKTFMKSREDARQAAFWMLDQPVSARRPGWPLDSLSKELDDTSFLDEGVELKPSTTGQTKKAWVRFLVSALGLDTAEEA
ncbi:MAG: non-canonical purine NTP pyrophosphatase [Clostridia bacterium]|nr:non-canonical purine NTP pyrophosphatase [Clostridia bacterium]